MRRDSVEADWPGDAAAAPPVVTTLIVWKHSCGCLRSIWPRVISQHANETACSCTGGRMHELYTQQAGRCMAWARHVSNIGNKARLFWALP